MADYKVTDTELINVANAIRTKAGISTQLEWPSEFITAISNISGSSGPINILSGSSIPASNVGNNGDLYIHTIPIVFYEYAYIGDTRGAYFDTGVKSAYGDDIEVKYQPIQSANYSPFESEAWVIGTRVPNKEHKGGYKNNIFGGYNGGGLWTKEVDYNAHVLKMNSSGTSFDGNNVGNAGNAITDQHNYYLFAINDNGTPSKYIRNTKVYYIKITKGNTVYDFVPILDNNDVCFLDVNSGTIIRNLGSVPLIGGPVIDTINRIDSVYLKKNGQWMSLYGLDINDFNASSYVFSNTGYYYRVRYYSPNGTVLYKTELISTDAHPTYDGNWSIQPNGSVAVDLSTISGPIDLYMIPPSNYVLSNDETLGVLILSNYNVWFFNGYSKVSGDVGLPNELSQYTLPSVVTQGRGYTSAESSEATANIGFYNGNIRSWNTSNSQTISVSNIYGVVEDPVQSETPRQTIAGATCQTMPYMTPYEYIATHSN